jgi:hypothetical protein
MTTTNTLKSTTVGGGNNTGAVVATLDSSTTSASTTTNESATSVRVYHIGDLSSGDLARFRSTLTHVITYDQQTNPDIDSALGVTFSHQPGFVFAGSGSSETFFSGTSYQSTSSETAPSWQKFVEDNLKDYPGIADEPDIAVIQALTAKPVEYGIGQDPSTWTTTEIEESAATGISMTRLVGDVYQFIDGPETIYLLKSTGSNPYYYGELGIGSYDEGVFSKIEDYAAKNATDHIGSQWPKVKFKTLDLKETDATDGPLTVKFSGDTIETLLTSVQCDTEATLAPYKVFRSRLFGDSISMQIGDEYNFTEYSPTINLGVQTAVAIGNSTGWMIQESDIPEDDQTNRVWSASVGDASKAFGSFYSYSAGFARSYMESATGGIVSREGLGQDKLTWTGLYTSTDTGVTTNYASEVGIDISETSSLSHTETTTCALLLTSETQNLSLNWAAAGLKSSLDIAGVHIDLEMPPGLDPMKKLLVKIAKMLGGDEENKVVMSAYKNWDKGYLNTSAFKAITLQTETWLDGIENDLNSGVAANKAELGALKQDLKVGMKAASHAQQINARTAEVAAQLNDTAQNVASNVAQFDQSKGYILRAKARLNELHS